MVYVWLGVFCIVVAEFSTNMGSLTGSKMNMARFSTGIWYGGIFLVAFLPEKINGNPVFLSAVVSEILVIALYALDKSGLLASVFSGWTWLVQARWFC